MIAYRIFLKSPFFILLAMSFFCFSCSDDNPNDAGVTVNITYTPGATTGTMLHFSATYSGAALNDALYVWNYGDGSPADTVHNNTHTFYTAGRYTVMVSIYDHVTGTLHAQGILEIDVTDFVDGYFLVASPASVLAGDSVTFEALNIGDASFNASYEWDFGDGSTIKSRRNDSVRVHVYDNGGTYTVTCKIYECKTNTLRAFLTKDITIKMLPYPEFATYIRLAIHGKFVYHRQSSQKGVILIDSLITLDTISTRVLYHLYNEQSESMVWNNGIFTCDTVTTMGRIIKHLSSSVSLSDDGSSIQKLVLNGIYTHTGNSQRLYDTLNVSLSNIPLVGTMTRSYAKYRISGQEYRDAITTMRSCILNADVASGYSDVRTFQSIVPNSDGYIEIVLYMYKR